MGVGIQNSVGSSACFPPPSSTSLTPQKNPAYIVLSLLLEAIPKCYI